MTSAAFTHSSMVGGGLQLLKWKKKKKKKKTRESNSGWFLEFQRNTIQCSTKVHKRFNKNKKS